MSIRRRKLAAAQQLTAALSPGTDPNTSAASDDATCLPHIIRSNYVTSIADWALGSLSKSKAGKGATPAAAVHLSPELWTVLATVLQSHFLPSGYSLPASLLSGVTKAVEDVANGSCPSETCAALPAPLTEILTILRTQYSAAYKPSLEHLIGLIEAVLAASEKGSEWSPVATAGVAFALPMLQQHPNQRKVWDAVVPRLLPMLLAAAFPRVGSRTRGDSELEGLCRLMLQSVLFNAAHVLGKAGGTKCFCVNKCHSQIRTFI